LLRCASATDCPLGARSVLRRARTDQPPEAAPERRIRAHHRQPAGPASARRCALNGYGGKRERTSRGCPSRPALWVVGGRPIGSRQPVHAHVVAHGADRPSSGAMGRRARRARRQRSSRRRVLHVVSECCLLTMLQCRTLGCRASWLLHSASAISIARSALVPPGCRAHRTTSPDPSATPGRR
jgi:hypothetical protein